MSDTKNLVKAWGNHKMRQEFLMAYKDWGVWITTPELDISYYRYALPDGAIIIAMEHKQRDYIGYKSGYGWKTSVSYYFQKPSEPFSPSVRSIWEIADILKDAKASLLRGEK